jgi:hypothetical protein
MIIATLVFYGLLVALAVGLAWASRNAVTQQLALLLMTAWALSNAALAAFGYSGEPYIVPSLDGAVAVGVAWVGYKNGSRTALVVFLLYVFLGGVHVAAWAMGRLEGYLYYGVKNLIFIGQLLVVGGVSADHALRHWGLGGNQRVRAHSPGR